jgi:hypothetical protein
MPSSKLFPFCDASSLGHLKTIRIHRSLFSPVTDLVRCTSLHNSRGEQPSGEGTSTPVVNNQAERGHQLPPVVNNQAARGHCNYTNYARLLGTDNPYAHELTDRATTLEAQFAFLASTRDSGIHADTISRDVGTTRAKTKYFFTDAVGVSMKTMHLGCVPADKFEETRQRLGAILKKHLSLDPAKQAFARYCGQKKAPSQGPKIFHGKNCAPPMTATDIKEAGIQCTHQVDPGWAYIIPRRCWHFVRNSKSEARDKRSGRFISAETTREAPPSRKRRRTEEEKEEDKGAAGDSFAWDLRLVAFDK